MFARKQEPVWSREAHLAEATEYLNAALQLEEMGEKAMADSHFQNALYHEREAFATH